MGAIGATLGATFYLQPVFATESFDPFEFPKIVGDELQSFASRVSGDVQVVYANRGAFFLQIRSYLTVVCCRATSVIENLEPSDKIFNLSQIVFGSGALLHPVHELGQRYNANTHLSGRSVESISYFDGTTF